MQRTHNPEVRLKQDTSIRRSEIGCETPAGGNNIGGLIGFVEEQTVGDAARPTRTTRASALVISADARMWNRRAWQVLYCRGQVSKSENGIERQGP